MNLVKSNLAKKLIIILIILLLFNVAYPSMTYAVDLGGILLSPLYWLVLGIAVPADVLMGMTLVEDTSLLSIDFSWGAVGFLANYIFGDKDTDVVCKTCDKGYTAKEIESYNKCIEKGHKVYKFTDLFVGPDTIFSGKIKPLRANIFKIASGSEDNESNSPILSKSVLDKVTEAVASFYVLLRNICALIMLAGLIYTGIRILLSSNIPTKKTQYLIMLQDWLMGMGILIFSHIIMILIFELCDSLTNALGQTMAHGSIKWTLLKNMGSSMDSVSQILSLILYFWTNYLTFVFAIAYFKRFFWTFLLIIFAPIFAVMYAFGGQTKQFYTNWLKEFILNAMVQPFHLVIYTVLIGIPLRITQSDGWDWSNNTSEMMYALMAMSMIRPAEKYFRRMFNLDKGIANMASYDSGKQTINAVKGAVVGAVKTAVAVGATAMSAGAAAGAIGAAGALGSSGAAGALGEAGGTLDEAGNALSGAGDVLGQLGQSGNGADGLGSGSATPEWISEGWDKDSQGRYFNPYNEEWYTEDELNSGRDLPAYMDQDDFSDADIKAITEGIKQEGGAQGTTIDAANVTLNAGAVSMGEKLESVEKSDIKTIEEGNVDKIEVENPEIELDDGVSLDDPSGEKGNFWEAFLNKGGLEQIGMLGNQLFSGTHSIADTLYVDGMAPTNEWSATAKNRQANIEAASKKREENVKRMQDNWANNKNNIAIMTQKYMDDKKFTDQYSDKPEAYIRRKAEEKAKSALKDMSAYVSYGITDVHQAYNLYQNANKNGLSPEQSIRNYAGYQKFNSNAGNVGQINLSGTFKRNDYTSVEAAIPNAKTYYDAGYTSVKEMSWVNYMAEKLGKSPEFAMKVDEALKKKGKGGKLSYNGKDAEMKKVINQINSHYN